MCTRVAGQREGGCTAVGPPFGAIPLCRLVKAGRSVSSHISVVGVATGELPVSGGRGSLRAFLLHPFSVPLELLRAGNAFFPCGKGWGFAAPLEIKGRNESGA